MNAGASFQHPFIPPASNTFTESGEGPLSGARCAHYIAVLSDIGEPTQRFEVAGTHQGSLSWSG